MLYRAMIEPSKEQPVRMCGSGVRINFKPAERVSAGSLRICGILMALVILDAMKGGDRHNDA